MVDDFGENFMHNNERNLRKGGLNMAAFNRRTKFVNVYNQCTRLHVYTVAALDETQVKFVNFVVHCSIKMTNYHMFHILTKYLFTQYLI